MIGSPGFSRLDVCRDRASCRERLIRLKPGLLNGDIRMKHATFISRVGCWPGHPAGNA